MSDTSFKDFVIDQLSGVPELRIKRMFGGYGLYSGRRFFAILFEDRLYFKTNDQTRAEYLE